MAEDNFNEIFNLSEYEWIHPTAIGGKAFDLIKFLYDLRELPSFQLNDSSKSQLTEEDKEHASEAYYSTKSVADNFLLIAPILLYRLTETSLKDYLLILYKPRLFSNSTYRNRDNRVLTIEEAIMTADIARLKLLYNNSPAGIDITTITGYDIIDELRELNNSLKHNHDYVSEQLHNKNNIWATNDLITVKNIQDRISDFDHGISSFFYSLVNIIKPSFP